jgi:DNA-binding NarL/FixJ family response regulator
MRILVVEDHDVAHWGFRTVLNQQPWVERCLSAHTGGEAIELARRHEPAVALVDLFLGEESGAEVCETLRATLPQLRVLLISGAGWISPEAARAAGASGFIPKDWRADEIVAAVQMVSKGMTVFAPRSDAPVTPLSGRELDVLALIADGATNREIADHLYLSPHTVKEHTSSIYRKLDVRNRADASRKAERLGLTGARTAASATRPSG